MLGYVLSIWRLLRFWAGVDVRCYILLYYYYILYYIILLYIIHYYTIISYLILYYTLLFFYLPFPSFSTLLSLPFLSSSFLPNPLLFFLPQIFILYVSALTYGYLYTLLLFWSIFLYLLSPPLLFSSPFHPSSPLLPILSFPSDIYQSSILPHSQNTCRYFDTLIYIQSISHRQSDPACFIGVDGWGVMCVFVSASGLVFGV